MCESAALSMSANLKNSAVGTRWEKVSFHSNPKKGNAKEYSNCQTVVLISHASKVMIKILQARLQQYVNREFSDYRTIVLISHASKVMLKFLQARLQQYVNQKLPDVQAGFRKGRGNRDQISKIHWIIEKARECQKSVYCSLVDYAKAFDCVDHNELWKILK